MKQSYNIMLIDDDHDDHMIFTDALKDIDSNYICQCLDNALSGLNQLQSGNEKPACIFLDLNLPLMHGFEFLEQIKSSSDLKNIPVIIYTTSEREHDKKKAMEMGAQYFLSKPTSFKELKEKLSFLLKDATILN